MSGHLHHGPPAAPVEPGAPPESAHAPAVSSFRLLATLAIAGAAAGLLVVSVYRVTLPSIEKYAGQKVEAAVREVLKAPARWDTLYLVDGALVTHPPAGVDGRELARAFVGFNASGDRIGVAVTAQEPGFQEELLLMVGFDQETGALTGMKVLDQKETPGLGDKIERDSAFGGQFAGRATPLRGVKTVSDDSPDQVQTITGATISSRAVIRIINTAVAKWRPLLAAYRQGGGT
ncbi:MAG TPA: RnfABCDGE type electron transport complex subunit G [Gemmatimonadales bacterium]|nr:RnfABCDGE type electron transport complex subunit G [Gemmatimonadales bacterium]